MFSLFGGGRMRSSVVLLWRGFRARLRDWGVSCWLILLTKEIDGLKGLNQGVRRMEPVFGFGCRRGFSIGLSAVDGLLWI